MAELHESPVSVLDRPATAPWPAWALWLALGSALLFPTFLSLMDFVILARPGEADNPAQQIAYALGKVVQFGLPILCLRLFERRWPGLSRPHFRGLGLAVVFGLVVVAGMLALYYLVLRRLEMFEGTPAALMEKMEQFGVASPLGFAGFAIFITFFHSLLEEYYWRWFIFGWLRRHASLAVALTVSSLGFMSHHVIVLYVYLPGHFWTGVVPFCLCVEGGGLVWAWLYERSGSIYSPWLSHLLIDAGLFVIGYDLFFVRG